MDNLAAAGKRLGALGASKGGHARAAKLTVKQLSEIATNAVNARWKQEKEKQQTEEAGKYNLFQNTKRARIVTENGLKRARITLTNNK